MSGAITDAVWESNLFEVAETLLHHLPEEPQTAVAFDGYETKRPLGAGGMGEVYLAADLQTHREVAIKRLRACWFDPGRGERFRREIDTLAQLEHPFIARLYTAGVQPDGTPYFVMELVSGLPVDVWCEKEQLDLKARLNLFARMCEAVQYAHRRGIIHLDLKPSNVLITSKSEPKLLDFGIAKQLSEPGGNTAQTQIRLTPAFAAPEQVRGELVGTYTDVYALSVMLYQLLARELPDEDGRPPSRSSNRIDASAGEWRDLDRLCMRGLERAVADRYQSVDYLLEDVHSFLSGKPLRAGPNRTSYRISKFVRRNTRSLAIAASIFTAVFAGWIWFTVRLDEARQRAAAEQNRKERVENFVLSLFTMGDPDAAPARSATALDVINYGRKQAELIQTDPAFRTDLYRVLGNLYGEVGDYKQATDLLQRALRNENGSQLSRADTLLKLASVKAQDSEFGEAERLAHQANAILTQVRDAPLPQVAKGKAVLGFVLVAARRFKDAIPELTAAAGVQKRIHADDELASTLLQLSGAQMESGNYPEAVRLTEESLAINRRLYGNRNPRVGDDWENLGSIRQMENRPAEAIAAYTEADRVFESWYGKNNPHTVENLICLGQAEMSTGDLDAARRHLGAGIEGAVQALGPAAADTLLAYNIIGTLEQRAKHFDAARGWFQRLVEGGQSKYGKGSYIHAVGLSNLATLDQVTGNYAVAEAEYRDVIRYFQALGFASKPEFAKAELNLGKTLIAERRPAEAKPVLESALNNFRSQPEPSERDIKNAETQLKTLKAIASSAQPPLLH